VTLVKELVGTKEIGADDQRDGAGRTLRSGCGCNSLVFRRRAPASVTLRPPATPGKSIVPALVHALTQIKPWIKRRRAAWNDSPALAVRQ
jgi:hypothetical protein